MGELSPLRVWVTHSSEVLCALCCCFLPGATQCSSELRPQENSLHLTEPRETNYINNGNILKICSASLGFKWVCFPQFIIFPAVSKLITSQLLGLGWFILVVSFCGVCVFGFSVYFWLTQTFSNTMFFK